MFLIITVKTVKNLIYYTNADNCLNKRDELVVLVEKLKPDILIITEYYPKNVESTTILQSEIDINGFNFYRSNVNPNNRGVVIYVKDDIISRPYIAFKSRRRLLTTGCHQPFWTKNGC